MIDELLVRNLGVIEEARIEPSTGLTVVTGETGTGKTLLLGGLRLLLGGDARSDLVGPFAEEAVVEGRFLDRDGEEFGAGRRLPRSGRSRAYLDGSIASARALEEKVADLVEVVGQNDHVSLTRSAEARELVDRMLDEDGQRALQAYREAWEAWREATAAQERLGGDRAALARELDLVTFQSNEIEAAGFEPGDDEELTRLADRLRHAEEIVLHMTDALKGLEAARESLGEAVSSVRKAARLDTSLEALATSLAAAAETLSDLAADTRTEAEGIDLDPERQETVEARLTLLGDLRRKYGQTLEDVLEFGRQAVERKAELEGLLRRSEVIDEEVEATWQALGAAGNDLTRARRRAAEILAEAAVGHLRDLAFSDPVVRVDFEPADPGPGGSEQLRLLFASDARLQPGPVGNVASGGELSRLTLALRLAGGSGAADTFVFDEIDAGVGGATALDLGRKVADLARSRQVLCVTHLPQLAAFADRHYVVRREGNTTTVEPVEGEARIAELARMLAGLPESDRGRNAAEELLELAAAG